VAGLVVERDEVGERASRVDARVERHASAAGRRGVAVAREPVLVEERLAVVVAEVGRLAAGVAAPDAPEERPAAQTADDRYRSRPVQVQRPPLAHLHGAVAVAQLAGRDGGHTEAADA
jgi:hypothetical protein